MRMLARYTIMLLYRDTHSSYDAFHFFPRDATRFDRRDGVTGSFERPDLRDGVVGSTADFSLFTTTDLRRELRRDGVVGSVTFVRRSGISVTGTTSSDALISSIVSESTFPIMRANTSMWLTMSSVNDTGAAAVAASSSFNIALASNPGGNDGCDVTSSSHAASSVITWFS